QHDAVGLVAIEPSDGAELRLQREDGGGEERRADALVGGAARPAAPQREDHERDEKCRDDEETPGHAYPGGAPEPGRIPKTAEVAIEPNRGRQKRRAMCDRDETHADDR